MKKLIVSLIIMAFLALPALSFAKELKVIYIKKDAQVGILKNLGNVGLITKKYEWENKGYGMVLEIKAIRNESNSATKEIIEFLDDRDLDIPLSSIAWMDDDK